MDGSFNFRIESNSYTTFLMLKLDRVEFEPIHSRQLNLVLDLNSHYYLLEVINFHGIPSNSSKLRFKSIKKIESKFLIKNSELMRVERNELIYESLPEHFLCTTF